MTAAAFEAEPGEAVVERARAWIGTPYRHQASCRGAGTDCLGLLRGLWREMLGPEPEAVFHDLGLRVTINTDNRLVTDTTVSRELHLAHTELALTLDDVKRIVLNGFKAAFLPFHQRQDYVRRIADELARFHDDGTIVDARPDGSNGRIDGNPLRTTH